MWLACHRAPRPPIVRPICPRSRDDLRPGAWAKHARRSVYSLGSASRNGGGGLSRTATLRWARRARPVRLAQPLVRRQRQLTGWRGRAELIGCNSHKREVSRLARRSQAAARAPSPRSQRMFRRSSIWGSGCGVLACTLAVHASAAAAEPLQVTPDAPPAPADSPPAAEGAPSAPDAPSPPAG